MTIRYSASTGGFYDSEIHGSDIPADAVAITQRQHRRLLDGQLTGSVIVAGANGKPVLADPPPPSAEKQMAALRHRRDALLAACDYTQMPDVEMTDDLRMAWRAYRQSLRNLPQTTAVDDVVWPTPPA